MPSNACSSCSLHVPARLAELDNVAHVFDDLEAPERLEQPLGTVKTRIRLGLLKLRDALSAETAGTAEGTS